VSNPFGILGANTGVQTQAVDDVFKHTSNSEGGIHRQEGSKIVAQIAQLKYEVQHDRTITWVSLSPPILSRRTNWIDIGLWKMTERMISRVIMKS